MGIKSCCIFAIALISAVLLQPTATLTDGLQDLSCRKHKYGGIDWDGLRSTLEIYADKYMDRPHMLMKEFNLAAQYAMEYHPENFCRLGDLSLRLVLWLTFDKGILREGVRALIEGVPPETGHAALLAETFDLFWNLEYSWHDILRSGWPIFSLLASVAELVRDDTQDACVPFERLQMYIDFFNTAVYVSLFEDLSILQLASGCPEAVVTALASLADKHRHEETTAGNRYHKFTSTSPADQPPEHDVESLLEKAQSVARDAPSRWSLLTSPWPLWRYVDKIGAEPMVNVSSGSAHFWMYVFPHRVSSDGLISNRIRATRRPYCFDLFQTEVRRLAVVRPQSSVLRLVEAGPHIGDCLLWAAAEFGERVQGLAVEPVDQVVSRFRKSVEANAFQIELHRGWLGDKTSQAERIKDAPWYRLDDLVSGDIDVLKIHTNGGERAILDGASKIFQNSVARVVIVHSAEPDQLWNSAAFLLGHGYSVALEGQQLSLADATAVKNQVLKFGGLQVHAVAPTAGLS